MLKRIFSPPPLENLSNDAQMRGQLLHTLILGLGGMTLLIIAALIAFPVTDILELGGILYFSSALLLAGTILIYWLNQRGRVYIGGGLFLFLVAFAVTISDTPKELLAGRSLIFFIIPVMMSSFLLRSYASFIVGTILTIEHTLFWLYADVGITFSPFGIIAFYSFAYISWLGARAMENALKESYNTNKNLDRMVGARTKELAEANAYLEITNEQLKELDVLKSKFVSDVSHELRTPISNISIYLEMLYDMMTKLSQTLPQKAIEFISVARQETERLTNLINDILDTSRLEQSMSKPDMQAVDIHELIRSVVETNRLNAEAKGLALELTLAPVTPSLVAEPEQLKQVFTNLVANAINYTEKGSVNITTITRDDIFTFIIQDTGMGIADEDIPHLFERFYRGQQASRSSIPGTGLGLAISKEIIEFHRGDIEVQSQIDIGTNFIVNLPIHKEVS